MPQSTIKLQSVDGEVFDVDIRVAKMCGTIKTMLEDGGVDENDDTTVPLPNVKSHILRKILQWSQFHKDDPPFRDSEDSKEKRTDDLSLWDADFLNVDHNTLFEMILASNYLEIKGKPHLTGRTQPYLTVLANILVSSLLCSAGLMDITCKAVANMLKGKTPDEIRNTFTIPNDFTVGEEEQVRMENEWCEEKNPSPPIK